MAKLSEFSSKRNIKLLVFGDSGAGKSVFACGFPGKKFVFDFDNKISSPYNFYKKRNPAVLAEIDYEAISTNKVAGQPYKRFRQLLGGFEAAAQASYEGKAPFPFDTIILDSVTLYSEALMAEVILGNPLVKRAYAGVPAMQDYMIASSWFKSDLGRLLSLPCNVICVAHIQQQKDEATGEVTYAPMASGKLAEYLPKIFKEVYRAFVKREGDKILHVAQTRNDGKYECRTELQDVPSLVHLSFESIAKYMGDAEQSVPATAVTEGATK